MANLIEKWCDCTTTVVKPRRNLHVLSEKGNGRAATTAALTKLMALHYENPSTLVARYKRLGFKKASRILQAHLPKTPRARSGHLGEILAIEAAGHVLPAFQTPIRRLRYLDSREMALRGEDVVGINVNTRPYRFLKGESKSGINVGKSVVKATRKALNSNQGRLSEHAMVYAVDRLQGMGLENLARAFENYILKGSIPLSQMVHLSFGLCGNDPSSAYSDDLTTYRSSVEQHSVVFKISGHKAFVKSAYDGLSKYAP